jgi:hypothetical protein
MHFIYLLLFSLFIGSQMPTTNVFEQKKNKTHIPLFKQQKHKKVEIITIIVIILQIKG